MAASLLIDKTSSAYLYPLLIKQIAAHTAGGGA